jgi:hypothetical protein
MRVVDASLAAAAARNNAEWCHLFCAARGIDGAFEDARWFSAQRTPPLYPDVVTLRPGLDRERVLTGVDAGPGCSVKDSFADVDLETAGFRELFSAEWFVKGDGHRAAEAAWRIVEADEALAEWEAAWDDEPGGSRFFSPALLLEHDVAFLAHYEDGRICAGGLANRSADVVGLSNVFALGGDLETAFGGASAAAAGIWPGLPIIGYEHGAPLAAARAAGFTSVGDLRVWVLA